MQARPIPPSLCDVEKRWHILIVEDDPPIAEVVEYALEAGGFSTERVDRGAAAIARCSRSDAPDALVLDVGLPDVDGFEVCRQVRRHSSLPILFLTSRADEINRVVGLELGGDDYLAKPFSPRELVARLRAIRRRVAAPEPASAELRHGPFLLDPERVRLEVEGVEIDLTRQEFRLLEALLSSPGRVFTRSALLDRAWEEGGAVTDRTIDAHVKTLRRKLGESGAWIETVRGIGYRLAESPRLDGRSAR